MSEENVEMVRAAIDAYNRGDLEATFKDMAADMVYDLSRADGPNRGVYSGDQARGVVAEFTGIWASSRIEAHEFIEAGDDVIVPWTAHMVGRDGIEVEARVAWTFTVRAGKVERVCVYQDKREALEAAGVSE